MKRNDEIKLQLYIDSTEMVKNENTGEVELVRRNIGNSSDVMYVNMSMRASTQGHGNILLEIKYKNVKDVELVTLNNISVNVIGDIYDKLLEVLLHSTCPNDLYLIRDVFIKQTNNKIEIRYRDKNCEVVNFEFDKMNTTEALKPRS